jgi:hypothetical protein
LCGIQVSISNSYNPSSLDISYQVPVASLPGLLIEYRACDPGPSGCCYGLSDGVLGLSSDLDSLLQYCLEPHYPPGSRKHIQSFAVANINRKQNCTPIMVSTYDVNIQTPTRIRMHPRTHVQRHVSVCIRHFDRPDV